MQKIVLLDLDVFNVDTAEIIQNSPAINNLDTLIDKLNEEAEEEVVNKANSDEVIKIFDLKNFAHACNEQCIDLDSYWVTFVNFND